MSTPTAGNFSGKHVIVVCWRCRRIGVYSKGRFADLVGHSTRMPDALRIVAASGVPPCPRANKAANILHDRCEVSFVRRE